MTKASDKRDERLEVLHEQLVAKTAALVTSEGWAEYLAFASRFHNYSANNLLLILAQFPTASRIASYRKWQELGRQVTKGSKSIGIFAPMVKRREDATTGEERRYVSGFRIVSVFDVSQTEGDALPEDPARPVLLDGEAPEGLWDALAVQVADAGYTLRFGPSQRGENGYTEPGTKTVQITEGLSDAQACKTLAHELAHVLLHTDDTTLCADAIAHRNVAEIEAESVAHLVAAEHGLASDGYSIPYVAGWSNGKSEQIAATADRVLKTSRAILVKTAPAEAEELVAV